MVCCVSGRSAPGKRGRPCLREGDDGVATSMDQFSDVVRGKLLKADSSEIYQEFFQEGSSCLIYLYLLETFDHDLNQRPKPIDDGECFGGIIPFYGRTIQVSEIL